jgi:hypothetical protein
VLPAIYHRNVLGRGTLSGTNTDLEFPVRRVADGFASLAYPLLSGTVTSGVSGQVSVDLPSGERPGYFVKVRDEDAASIHAEVISDDIGGGSRTEHGTFVVSGAAGPEAFALSGVAVARRRWAVEFTQEHQVLHANSGETWTAFGAAASVLDVDTPVLGFPTEGGSAKTASGLGTPTTRFGMTYSGLMLVTDLRPTMYEQFTLDLGVASAVLPDVHATSGVQVSFSGDDGAVTWNLASGVVVSGDGPVQVVLALASGTVSGASGFVADRLNVNLLHSGGNWSGTPQFYLDNLRGSFADYAGTPTFHELMVGDRTPFPRSPSVGVARARVWQRTRLPIPGGSAFTVRQGDDLRAPTYIFVATEAETVTGIEAFLRTNDTGEPFMFLDDRGALYWAEMLGTETVFDDQGGVYTYRVSIREIVPE